MKRIKKFVAAGLATVLACQPLSGVAFADTTKDVVNSVNEVAEEISKMDSYTISMDVSALSLIEAGAEDDAEANVNTSYTMVEMVTPDAISLSIRDYVINGTAVQDMENVVVKTSDAVYINIDELVSAVTASMATAFDALETENEENSVSSLLEADQESISTLVSTFTGGKTFLKADAVSVSDDAKEKGKKLYESILDVMADSMSVLEWTADGDTYTTEVNGENAEVAAKSIIEAVSNNIESWADQAIEILKEVDLQSIYDGIIGAIEPAVPSLGADIQETFQEYKSLSVSELIDKERPNIQELIDEFKESLNEESDDEKKTQAEDDAEEETVMPMTMIVRAGQNENGSYSISYQTSESDTMSMAYDITCTEGADAITVPSDDDSIAMLDVISAGVQFAAALLSMSDMETMTENAQ